MADQRKKRKNKKCAFCKEYIVRDDLDNWKYSRRKFCNHTCFSGWKREQRHTEEYKNKMSERLKGRKITWSDKLKNGDYLECPICLKKFYANKGSINNGRRFCSKSCSKMFSGNPMWKGGRSGDTRLRDQIDILPQYKLWRMAVFSRDMFKCVECGVPGKTINAHHVIPISEIINEFSITDIDEAVNCIPLWMISNGKTLCVDCHKKEHKKKK